MRHVLVIEAEYLLARLMADMAQFVGASSVAIADSPASAGAAAKRHRPSVIVSDVDLKQAGRGREALREVRELCGAVPVILVSARGGDPFVCEQAMGILRRPFSAEEFVVAFRQVSDRLSSWRPARAGMAWSNDFIEHEAGR